MQALDIVRIAIMRDEVRERMSDNLYRCGAHSGIIDSIMETFPEAAE